MTQSGFLRPHFSRALQASEARNLAQICPGMSQTLDAEDRRLDPLWGPYITARTGFASDPKARHHGASGAALSAMLTHLLKSAQIDGVIHVTANPDAPLENITTVSHTADQVLNAAGSRYAPSSPLDMLQNLHDDGRRYAFVGKPCDVSALHALRRIDQQTAQMVPILLSFFCAGVPALKGGQEITRQMGVATTDLAQFQHRGEGWPGRATATLKDGSKRTMSYADSWGNILSKQIQHRCKICADGSGVFADVVFADVWETDAAGYPDFGDRPGQSLVLSRTSLGEQLVRDAQASHHLTARPYDLSALMRVQPGQTRRRRALLARLAALWVMGQPIPRYRGMGLLTMARAASFHDNLRNFAGMARRIWRTPSTHIKEERSC